jgi:nucleotide-binding universal stress UspA family protein
MFERILVPLDGSAQAARAVPVAARIAGCTHGSVILVSVVNYFVLSQYPQTDRNNRTWIGDDLSMSEAQAYLDEVACSPALAHVTVEKAILSGPIASALLSAAASYQANLIMLISHMAVSSNGAHDLRLGSVAEKIVCRATIPVLLLREKGAPPLWFCPQMDRRASENLMPYSPDGT